MLKYLIPFIIAFGLTIIFLFPVIYLAKKIPWRGRISGRHIHSIDVLRAGGIVMVVAFVATIFLNRDLTFTSKLFALVFGALALLVVGVWDDFQEISWKIQLFFQITLAIFIFIMGIRIYYVTNPIVPGGIINLNSGLGVIISSILVIVWVILVINSLNWSDGIDGLSGGIAFIAAAVIFFLSLKPEVNQPAVAIISAIFAGTILAFVIFNYYPSRILAGTAGSLYMGFALSAMAIFAGTKIATALLVLAIPVIDFLWVIKERIRKGKSIFRADKNHLHYKLLKLGWSQRRIVWTYWGITAIIAFFALNTRAFGKGVALLIAALVVILALAVIGKKVSRTQKARL